MLGTVLTVIVLFTALMAGSECSSREYWAPVVVNQVQPGPAALDSVAFALQQAERISYREFWGGLLKTILINVLLPVLTALLGYVFGTQSRS